LVGQYLSVTKLFRKVNDARTAARRHRMGREFADAFLNKYFEKVIRLSVTAPSAVIFAASEWLSA
jgi:hypothetical protein